MFSCNIDFWQHLHVGMKDCFNSVGYLDVDILVKYMLIHHVVLQQLTTDDIEKPVISVTQKTIKNGFLGEKTCCCCT